MVLRASNMTRQNKLFVVLVKNERSVGIYLILNSFRFVKAHHRKN